MAFSAANWCRTVATTTLENFSADQHSSSVNDELAIIIVEMRQGSSPKRCFHLGGSMAYGWVIRAIMAPYMGHV
jgi:hypothetical protein